MIAPHVRRVQTSMSPTCSTGNVVIFALTATWYESMSYFGAHEIDVDQLRTGLSGQEVGAGDAQRSSWQVSVRRRPVTQARGERADSCLNPQGQSACPMPQPARPEVSVLSAVINALPDPFAVADRSGRIVFQNIHWTQVVARNALCTNINSDEGKFLRRFGIIGSSLPDPASAATDLRRIFAGERRSFALRHKINDGRGERWLQMDATGISALPGHVAIIHRNVNDLRQAQGNIKQRRAHQIEMEFGDHEGTGFGSQGESQSAWRSEVSAASAPLRSPVAQRWVCFGRAFTTMQLAG